MKWPISVAPYDCAILPMINKNDNSNLEKSRKIYNLLKEKDTDVLLDDVDENISNKFRKHDLLGIPYQIIVGSKSTKDQFEFKEVGEDEQSLEINQIINILKK